MTLQQKFDEHCQSYAFATRGRLGTDGWNRIEKTHFDQELKIRLKKVRAFDALDELRRERTSD